MTLEDFIDHVGMTVSERIAVRSVFGGLRADGYRVVKLEETGRMDLNETLGDMDDTFFVNEELT